MKAKSSFIFNLKINTDPTGMLIIKYDDFVFDKYICTSIFKNKIETFRNGLKTLKA